MGGLLLIVECGLGEATPIERPRPAGAGESIGWGVGRCRVIFGSRGSTGVDTEACESWIGLHGVATGRAGLVGGRGPPIVCR